MDKSEIKKLSEKNFKFENLQKAKEILQKNYEISYGQYEPEELAKAISNKTPFYINDYFIVGKNPQGHFISDNDELIDIQRMVKAVIVESEKNNIPDVEEKESGDLFAIIGKMVWEEPIPEFMSIIVPLQVGETFLPPHSAVFNFLIPTKEEEEKNIVSMLDGINVNVYQYENYIDNIIHEIGHLFWRDCVKFEEKKQFKEHYENLKISALYQFEWERNTEEEVFCTLYKWYVKGLLINPSFENILKFEDPKGFELMQNLFNRVKNDRFSKIEWDMKKGKLFEYLNPPYDKVTGKRIIKQGTFEQVKDIEIPGHVLQNVDRFEEGTLYVDLEKAVVPVVGNKIDWKTLEKAKRMPIGTISKGRKKIAEGKWVKVEEEKKTIEDIKNKYKEMGVFLLIGESKELITLNNIKVDKEKQKKGLGTKVMKELIKFADDNNKKIALTPTTEFGASSINKLKNFYKNFGFVENKGKNKDYTINETMYWKKVNR